MYDLYSTVSLIRLNWFGQPTIFDMHCHSNDELPLLSLPAHAYDVLAFCRCYEALLVVI